MTHLVQTYGLWLLFLVVALEMCGLFFVPGETALIAASIEASDGHLHIAAVIAVAAGAAIAGGSAGFAIGEFAGRPLVTRLKWLEWAHDPTERFFARHGPKAVLLARFVAIVRAVVSIVAGISEMPFRTYFVWNAIGSCLWATIVGLLVFYLGRAVADYGAIGIGVVTTVGVLVYVGHHFLRRRLEPKAEES